MKKIAITGNIASGKSVAEKIIQNLGYPVYDTDELAHTILANSKDVIEAFKNYDIMQNGKISRKKLGEIVFNNNTLREKLEMIIHPLVKTKLEEIFEEHKNEKYVFIGIPLLFEANMQDMFDKIVLIYCDDNIRLVRLMNRNNLSKSQAFLRLNSQISQENKVELVDYVIKNETSPKDLEKQIKHLFMN